MIASIPPQEKEQRAAGNPMGRFAAPAEMAAAAAFLASDEAAYITGVVLPVDGASRFDPGKHLLSREVRRAADPPVAALSGSSRRCGTRTAGPPPW